MLTPRFRPSNTLGGSMPSRPSPANSGLCSLRVRQYSNAALFPLPSSTWPRPTGALSRWWPRRRRRPSVRRRAAARLDRRREEPCVHREARPNLEDTLTSTKSLNMLLLHRSEQLFHNITTYPGSRRVPPDTLVAPFLPRTPTLAMPHPSFPARRGTRAPTHLCTPSFWMSLIPASTCMHRATA